MTKHSKHCDCVKPLKERVAELEKELQSAHDLRGKESMQYVRYKIDAKRMAVIVRDEMRQKIGCEAYSALVAALKDDYK
ncbi:MAG: hypothetical protein GY832_23565 [Chloroflexi bacterium]|nr:hypothetical protein [Chloroflexota bacterium]